jgi:hypothetical protein
LLRFAGLINAAAWFGAALFLVFGVDPAISSPTINDLLGPRNFPYFSGAINQVVTVRYLHFYLFFSIVALAHIAGEWLYLGKYPTRSWLALVLGLILAGLVQNYWLQPKLQSWHRLRFTPGPQSQAIERNFVYTRRTSETINLLTVVGLAVYLWRVANPPDPARFLSASKFRS